MDPEDKEELAKRRKIIEEMSFEKGINHRGYLEDENE